MLPCKEDALVHSCLALPPVSAFVSTAWKYIKLRRLRISPCPAPAPQVCAQGLLLGSLSCIPPTTFLQSPTRALSTTLPGPACVCTYLVALLSGGKSI